jgi:hypothetical protein
LLSHEVATSRSFASLLVFLNIDSEL